ncbi:MAG: response regulator transcription factor [Verrucomicrobiae bacterium]|nr:response regulator transcription factor [Verrucomicrobiae bacterium]
MKILYVEDSASLRDTVSRGLRKAGFTVDVATDGETGLDLALAGEYAVVVLDVMLPGLDGFEVLRELRKAGSKCQILMLTARVEIADRVRGLETGADDYLVKPFAWEEFLARVRTLVRRRFRQPSDLLEMGDLRIDLRAHRAWVDGSELDLRPREFGILQYLALRGGEIVTRTEILEEVYDHSVDLKSNAIDAAVCNVRRILSESGLNDAIKTIPRRGYLIEKKISRKQHGAS